nr:hypothetical protein BaRGS_010175 [Batillaria attramentaria]
MSRDAVKFGRMSKKQREKVEDEAKMVKAAQMNGIANPQYQYPSNGYSYPVNTPQAEYSPPPSSDSGGLPGNLNLNANGNVNNNNNNSVATLPYQTAATSPTSPPHPVALVRAVDLMDAVTLGNAISEAHLRTCLYSNEQIELLKQQTVTQEVVNAYKAMNHRQLWVELSDKITLAVQQIIEFAKMIPGFMDLSQDDQIMLLKAGSFELALLQACRVYDPNTNRIIFGNHFLPLEAFSSLRVKEQQDIQKLHEKILAALKMEIGNNHSDGQEILSKFVRQASVLRDLSSHHIHILNRFKESAPDVEFPALHKELFSVDTSETSS